MVMIMEINDGSSALQRNRYVGFNLGDTDQEHQDMKSKVMEELKKTFRPEFLNRIDETIVFHSLEKEHMKYIVKLMIEQGKARVEEQNIHFVITASEMEK